jgi:hypothetical protein
MATGTSLTEVNGEGSLALQNQRVSVPLNQNGLASGSPTAATSLENDEFISQMLDDLYQRLLEDKQLANAALTRLNQALDRCIGGRAAYVYNVLYWIRIIENSPGFKSLIDSAKLVQTYDRVPNCLSFEIDFDSTVITTHPDLYKSSHLPSEGLSLEFLADGTFIALNNSLNYLSHVFNPSQYCGTITTQKMPGELQMDGGSLKIAGNKVRVSMLLRVSKQPTDSATLSCPPAPPLVLGQQHWVSVFYHLHEDLWQKPDPVFRFTDWKYNGGENFAEAIYVRTLTESEFTFDTTTFLVLVHTPQK